MNETIIQEMLQAFDEIQQPRTPYVLEHMVVGSRFTLEQQYAQCVLELSIAYDNLRTAKCNARIKEIDIEEHPASTEKDRLNKEILEIELEQLNRARLGAEREFEYLFNKWQSYPKKFNRAELNDAQEQEFIMRLETQALMDKNASGRISVGNQEGLRQIGRMPYPELDEFRLVEKRFLESGDIKLSIVIPTEFKDEKLECLQGLEFPAGVQVRVENCYGMPVADAYNQLFNHALEARSDYILTVEDDTFPQPDALIKLMEFIKANPKTAIGAYYIKKEQARQGVHIVIENGQRTQLKDDGEIHEVYTLAMGCSLYPVEMLKFINYPYFKTTDSLSQDSFFSQLAREAGYKLLVDTSIKCKHIDRITKEVYE